MFVWLVGWFVWFVCLVCLFGLFVCLFVSLFCWFAGRYYRHFLWLFSTSYLFQPLFPPPNYQNLTKTALIIVIYNIFYLPMSRTYLNNSLHHNLILHHPRLTRQKDFYFRLQIYCRNVVKEVVKKVLKKVVIKEVKRQW